MTISNPQASVTVQGDGVTTQFSYQFLIPAAQDVVVSITDTLVSPAVTSVVAPGLYTITGLGLSEGGLVTYPLSGTPIAAGFEITIARTLLIIQTAAIGNQGNFYSSVVEGALDYLTMVCQDLQSEVNDLTRADIEVISSITNSVATVALLKAAIVSAPLVGTSIYLQGYHAANDDGGGIFLITNVNPGADNGGTIIWSNTAGFYYVRQTNGAPNSVKWFGAKGDGTTDDTTAIQNCINYCQDNLGTVYLPANNVSATYKLTASLSVTKPVCIIGAGSYQTTLLNNSLSAGQYVLNIDGTAFGTFDQGRFGGFTLYANGTPNLMQVKNVSSSYFYDIGLRNGVRGIVYTGTRCFSNTFEKIMCVGAGVTGFGFYFTSHTGGGQHVIRDSTFNGNTGAVIDSTCYVDSVTFENCNFEQCTTNSFFCGGTVRALDFFGGRTEGCDGVDFQIRPSVGNFVQALNVQGVSFSSSDAGGSARISLGGDTGTVRGFVIVGNAVGHGADNFSASFVALNGDGESGTIANNYLDGLLANCAPVNVRRANVAVYNNEAFNGKFPGQFSIEEGTFVPTDASGAGLAFTGASGSYTRIGRMVFGQMTLTYPATADASGTAIAGVPYTYADGASWDRAGFYISFTDAANVNDIFRVGANVTLFKTGVVATNANLSGKILYIGFQFSTTAV